MFSSGITDWTVSQVLGLISISSVPEIKKQKKKMTAGFLREGDSSPKPFQYLSLGRPDCSWGDDNFNTSQAEVIHQTRGVSPRPHSALRRKRLTQFWKTVIKSSFTVQNDWNRFLTLSDRDENLKKKRLFAAVLKVQFEFLSCLNQTSMEARTAPGLTQLGLKKLRNIWGNHFLSTDPWKTEGWNIWGGGGHLFVTPS